MASNDMQCRQAVLSIDIGDTAAHAIFAWRHGEETHVAPIRCLGEGPGIFEFSTDIFPFDDGPIMYKAISYLDRDERERERKIFPARSVAHVLLDKIDTMQRQNPVGIRLKKERRKDGFNEVLFKAGLEDAFKQFLRYILRSAKEAAGIRRKPDNLQIQVKTVAMAVPSHWDVSFRKLYERLLKDVFAEVFEELPTLAARNMNVVFQSEATAISQYFLHATSDARGLALRNEGIIPDIDTIGTNINTQLFIKWGGHHVDSILTTIQRDECGKRFLCEGGQPQGVEGGAEWWADQVMEEIIYRTLPRLDGRVRYDDLKQSLIHEKDLVIHKAYQRLNVLLDFRDSPETTFGLYGFTKDESKTAFHLGFMHVTRMVEKQLQRLSSFKSAWGTNEHTVTIILAGASTRQVELEFTEWMESSCARLKLPKPIDLRDMATFCGGAQVARGAAYATLAQQARGNTAPKAILPRPPALGSKEAEKNKRRLLRLGGLPVISPEMTPEARADDAANLPPIDNVSSLGEALSSGQTASASNAPEGKRGKRKASVEPDGVVSAKALCTYHGLSIRTASSTSKDASSTGNETSSTGKDGSST